MEQNNLNYIQSKLKTNWLGKNLSYYQVVGSTNEIAINLAEEQVPEGTVVLAESQTGGVGRLQRKWLSGEGGVWFSVVLRPKIEPTFAPQLTLLTAVAVAEAIYRTTGLRPGIKWPNDILINGRKTCGILCEMNMDHNHEYAVVIGIGLNVNQTMADLGAELSSTATSLSIELGRNLNKFDLFHEVLFQLENWYTLWQEAGFAQIRHAWKKHSVILGEQVKLVSGDQIFSGLALDIDDFGTLLLKDNNDKVLKFNFGEISLRLNNK